MKYLNKYNKFSIDESYYDLLQPKEEEVIEPEITDEDGDEGSGPIHIEEGDIVEVEGQDVEVTRVLSKIGGDLCISFEGKVDGRRVHVVCDDAGSGYQFV